MHIFDLKGMKMKSFPFVVNWRLIAVMLIAIPITGCGGGGGGDVLPNATSFVNWENSSNGIELVDANNELFRVQASDRTVVNQGGTSLIGLQVSSNADIIRSGKVIGSVGLINGSGGTKIAAMFCSNGARLDIIQSGSTYTVSGCDTLTTSNTTPNTTPNTNTNTSYVNWTGSANGALIADANDEFFRVRPSDNLVEAANGGGLNGLQVSANADVIYQGQPIGSVRLVNGSAGNKIAAFVCSNGASMDIILGTGTYSVSGCESGSGSGSGSGNPTPTPSPDSSITFTYYDRLITSGVYNSWRIFVTNTSSVKVSCAVGASYQYYWNGSLVWGQQTQSVILDPGVTDSTDFGFTDRNILTDKYHITCSKWPF